MRKDHIMLNTLVVCRIWKGLDVDWGCFAPWDPRSEVLSGLRQAHCRDIIMIGAVSYLIYWRRRIKDRANRMLK